MILSDIKFHSPQTLAEAFTLLKELSEARIVAGGTDLYVDMKQGLMGGRNIISLHKIEGLKGIEKKDKKIRIGAMVSAQEIISDFVEVLSQDSILSENTNLKNIDIKDKDDILILSTALNGNAELFVTGDKELLDLEKIHSMRIVSPRKFWETLKTQPPDEH